MQMQHAQTRFFGRWGKDGGGGGNWMWSGGSYGWDRGGW